jgi:hypothetical protein
MQTNIAGEASQGSGQIAEPSQSIGQAEVEERFFDFALNFADPRKLILLVTFAGRRKS